MHAALQIAREKQCNAAFCLKFLSTLLHHSPLRCCSRCCTRGSLLSPVISRPSPRNFSPPRSRAAAAAHLSTLASLSPKFRYRTHRTTSTESGGRVFAFSLPPPPPSFLCHGVSGGTGGNSLPPVPRRVRPLSLPIPTTTKSCLRRAHSETWVVTFR